MIDSDIRKAIFCLHEKGKRLCTIAFFEYDNRTFHLVPTDRSLHACVYGHSPPHIPKEGCKAFPSQDTSVLGDHVGHPRAVAYSEQSCFWYSLFKHDRKHQHAILPRCRSLLSCRKY